MYHRTSAKKAVIGCEYSAGILEQSMGAIGTEKKYSVSLHRLAESMPWDRFLGFLKA
jgi:hypothetical protein